ncbi:hypothetical protein CFOL_v3_17573, partial [Cephalotus follicularis]
GLVYRNYGHQRIEGFSDADWAESPVDRRSTSGYCAFVGGNLVSCKGKKQPVVARLSAESEYRAMTHITCEVMWVKQLLSLETIEPEIFLVSADLNCDNQTTIHISDNPVFHECTEPIKVDCYLVRDEVRKKVMSLSHVPSNSQIADIFIKAL